MATTASAAEPGVLDEVPFEEPRPLQGWRGFLNSWWIAAIFAVALVVGVVAIVTANPFGSQGVSERISHEIGQPASCTSVGATHVAGENLTIYKCTVGLEKNRRAQCFTLAGGEVRQLSGTRRLGC